VCINQAHAGRGVNLANAGYRCGAGGAGGQHGGSGVQGGGENQLVIVSTGQYTLQGALAANFLVK